MTENMPKRGRKSAVINKAWRAGPAGAIGRYVRTRIGAADFRNFRIEGISKNKDGIMVYDAVELDKHGNPAWHTWSEWDNKQHKSVKRTGKSYFWLAVGSEYHKWLEEKPTS